MTSTCKLDKRGNKIWRNKKGQLHREDAPAVERVDGTKSWYLNGRRCTFKDYCNELLKRKLITEHNLILFKIKYGE